MHPAKILLGCLLVVLAGCSLENKQAGGPVLFEGARLIDGDGGPAIENAAFLVENHQFAKVGRKGEIEAPAGRDRVDLTGKTVLPALVGDHTHLGHAVIKTG